VFKNAGKEEAEENKTTSSAVQQYDVSEGARLPYCVVLCFVTHAQCTVGSSVVVM